MKNKVRVQLCFMMFLEFFIWGAWFVTLGTFLGNNLKATDGEIALAFSTQSWGAIIAPFVIGIIADRYFNAERILGVLHLVGATLMYFMYQSTEFDMFYILVLGYMILYMPTLALVNSVSFNQMKNPAKEFSMVRVFGTVGWIIAGLSISYIFSWDQGENIGQGLLRNTFLMTAIASFILGVFSFTLPKTPPKAASSEKLGIKEILGLDSLSLFKDKNFLIFFISSVLICIPLAFYYQNANPFLVEIGMDNPTGKMTLGQISEIAFMLLLPYFFTKFGFKKTILVAMAAWVARYLLFAFGDVNELGFMLIIGIALHGICYDFFFVSGQIYTDSKAGDKFKSSAQGLITLATYGVGMLIGFWIAGKISTAYLLADGKHVWETIWMYPAGFALAVFILFAIFFKTEKIEYQS
ncbi:nucleoside permease [Maribacter hydrothermalis]|uniref:MFS transporter n=1 Tax=Maribacter hydrothermalis TaxID=1836467 RepID=A0A1B7ZEN8_9FLAO|nr:nucleoside permease [Maribacter hydrothermalis]APQ17519.1 MFS transporter [Maribacter hydrothermalis]OBR41994.1 MFS transporter [Maribacter hydrothermalis]